VSTATLSPKTKSVPRDALRLRAARGLLFAVGSGSASEVAIKMLARSPEAIEHWYWGRIAHDMTGMTLRKDRLAIDWCHHSSEAIGYIDTFNANERAGLTVAGKLVSVADGDRAAEVIAKGRAGIPFESSIDFDGPMRLEEIGEGLSAECNGRTIVGPATIVREWTLNAVAVCPFGADPNTRTQFSATRPGELVNVVLCERTPEQLRLEAALGRNLAKVAAAIRLPKH
jgi:hypothetical protein